MFALYVRTNHPPLTQVRTMTLSQQFVSVMLAIETATQEEQQTLVAETRDYVSRKQNQLAQPHQPSDWHIDYARMQLARSLVAFTQIIKK